jgi:hypothetical protein
MDMSLSYALWLYVFTARVSMDKELFHRKASGSALKHWISMGENAI